MDLGCQIVEEARVRKVMLLQLALVIAVTSLTTQVARSRPLLDLSTWQSDIYILSALRDYFEHGCHILFVLIFRHRCINVLVAHLWDTFGAGVSSRIDDAAKVDLAITTRTYVWCICHTDVLVETQVSHSHESATVFAL